MPGERIAGARLLPDVLDPGDGKFQPKGESREQGDLPLEPLGRLGVLGESEHELIGDEEGPVVHALAQRGERRSTQVGGDPENILLERLGVPHGRESPARRPLRYPDESNPRPPETTDVGYPP